MLLRNQLGVSNTVKIMDDGARSPRNQFLLVKTCSFPWKDNRSAKKNEKNKLVMTKPTGRRQPRRRQKELRATQPTRR
jgi:hypothetical protein